MKQLIQNFKTGHLGVLEIPAPALREGFVLVRNHCSVLSPGTEKSTVQVAKSSLIGKAKQRPDLVAQVIKNLKKEGIKATLDKVKTKLDTPKSLGYSSAGVVLAVGDGCEGDFSVGDRVACAGQDYASHAEIVAVPKNLVAKIPDNVSFEEASFCTIGAIALQGVRQMAPEMGGTYCVIGLGLIGQITCELLRANGCKVFGIDMNSSMLNFVSKELGIMVFHRNDEGLVDRINQFSQMKGVDGVIITASAPNNDPIILSTEILRRRGTIVVVGNVQMNIPREPFFYKKELSLKISCSYGPGRYDPTYEELGQDYPFEYVRWTEKRNMEGFLDLASMGKLSLKKLISHEYDIADATKAYDLLLAQTPEFFNGIVIQYPKSITKTQLPRLSLESTQGQKKSDINVGFIGAGNFAQNFLIPNLKNLAHLKAVVNLTGPKADNVRQKFSFENSSTDIEDILSQPAIDTVFISTRHDSHAQLVKRCLLAKKNVFVEKPLAVNYEELEELAALVESGHNTPLMVGFNRRFSKHAAFVSQYLQKAGTSPLTLNYRINAGAIPKDSWVQLSEGGRIVGEVCHFIDLMQFFTQSHPKKIFASPALGKENSSLDNLTISLMFADGSIGNITYVSTGNPASGKEKIEIFGRGLTCVIDDFKTSTVFKGTSEEVFKDQSKGHKEEVQAFIEAIKLGKEMPIGMESLFYTTLATFKVLDSIKTGLPEDII